MSNLLIGVCSAKLKQWGYVSKQGTDGGYAAFTLPVSATILAAASMLKSNQNNDGQLGWHGIGTWSTTQITVTWNTYEGRSPVHAVGFIAVCKAQKQWGYATWAEAGTPVNVTLPLPFSNKNYLIIACAYGGIDNFKTAALNTVTTNITSNSKFQLATYDYDRRYNYIAVGF